MDWLYPIIRAEQMHRTIIVQLFGIMCQNRPVSQAAMLLREGRRDSHWRQPWTPDSLTHVSEMTDHKSLHRACNRHMSMVELCLLLACQNQHHLLSLLSGFTPCHRGIK